MKIKTWKRRLARSCITFGLCLSGCTHWLQCERERDLHSYSSRECKKLITSGRRKTISTKIFAKSSQYFKWIFESWQETSIYRLRQIQVFLPTNSASKDAENLHFGLKTCTPPWRLENWAPFVANAFTASGLFAKICGRIFGQKLQVMNKCSRQSLRRWEFPFDKLEFRSWIRVDFILYLGSKCHHWIKLPQVWEKTLLKQKEYKYFNAFRILPTTKNPETCR